MIKYQKLCSKKVIVKFILGVIILSLILGTVNNYINQYIEPYAVQVNGKNISFKTLQNMYFLEQEKQKKILGKNFFKIQNNPRFIKKTYNYVLSQLINNVLLEQYTKQINFQTNDNKAKEIILNAPDFQENKKFNQEKYFNYLISINSTNHEYINTIKEKINTQNLIHYIASTNVILNDEKQHIIKLLSQKRRIKKAILKISSVLKKQNITDSESYNYFCKHKNNFYIPEKFKISFIQFQPDIFQTKCSNEEINEWYNNNIKQYFTKEKRKYSIIQVKTKDEALKVLSQLNTNENFSKIAKEKSIDPISSKNGGDIGWISIDMIPSEIKNANLYYKNQISKIIPFQNEFLIVKLSNILNSRQKQVSEVSDEIIKKIKYQKSIYLYHQLQQKILKIIKENPNQFNSIIKKINITPQETDWFDKNSIPEILNHSIIKKNIFNDKFLKREKKLQSHSGLIFLKNHQSFILSIKDYQNKKRKTFKSVQTNIINILKQKKAIKQIQKQSEEIIFQLKKGSKILFNKLNLYFNNSEIISRYDHNPISSILFSLPHPTKDKKIYTMYKNNNNDYEIILFDKIYYKKFSKTEKSIIIKYLEENNIETVLNSLLKNLRKKSIIKYGRTQ